MGDYSFMGTKYPGLVDNFLTGGLDTKTVNILKTIRHSEGVPAIEDCLAFGRLRPFQTKAVAMGYYNPRFFIGDAVGTGKTVELAGILYALNRKDKLDKVVVFTRSTALTQIAVKLRRFSGLVTSTVYAEAGHGARRRIQLAEYENAQIVVAPHSMLINDVFMEWFTNTANFKALILDDARVLKNTKAKTFQVVSALSQRMERVHFMNGTIEELGILDVYYQMDALNPSLLWNKTAFLQAYASQEKIGGFRSVRTISGRYRKVYAPKFSYYDIQRDKGPDFNEKISLHFLARSKRDIKADCPYNNVEPIMCKIDSPLTGVIRRFGGGFEVLNSPTLKDDSIDYNDLDKTKRLLEKADELFMAGEKFVIYTHFKDTAAFFTSELNKRNICAAAIVGDTKQVDRDRIMDNFNEKKFFDDGSINAVIITVTDAIELMGADYMLLHDFPYNPGTFKQVLGRIDRDNYDKAKTYYLFIYDNSSEIDNLAHLTIERAAEAKAYTGVVYEEVESLADWFRYTYPQYKAAQTEMIFNNMGLTI